MDIFRALVLGIIQGLTEWLPISSTAHLRLVPALMGWPDPGAAFTAVIQLGTLVAVLVYFWKDLVNVLTGWVGGLAKPEKRSSVEYKMGWGILVGTIPIVILGLLFKDQIENQLRSMHVIATALIAMGLLLAVAEKVGKKERDWEKVTFVDGLVVGLFQAVALIPGASRSGSTITGALFSGLERGTAARFSFLLSVPSVLGAAMLSIYSHRKEFADMGIMPILVANVASFIVGYASIAFMMRLIQKQGTLPFVVYRIVLGIAIFATLSSLQPQAQNASQEPTLKVSRGPV